MIKKLKLAMLSLSYMFAVIFMGSAGLIPVTVSALDCSNPVTQTDRLECGACATEGSSTPCDPSSSQTTLSDTIRKVINVVSFLAGAVAVVMIIVGGFRYITSAGNAEGTKNARNTIVYALIGLIVIAFAQVIIHFTLSTTT